MKAKNYIVIIFFLLTSNALSFAQPIKSNFTYTQYHGCHGDTVAFNNLSTPTGTEYKSEWNFGDKSPLDSKDTNPVHIYTAQGTYTVVLTYASLMGTTADTSAVIVVSHPITPGFFATPDTICAGQTISFTNTTIANMPQYSWNFEDGSMPDTATNPSHVFSVAGSYDVVLTEEDSLGCIATAKKYVYVGSIQVTTGFHDTSVCLNGLPMKLLTTVTKSDSNLFTSYTYLWTPSNNLNSTTISEPNFSGIGNFSYVFTVTTIPFGCTSFDTETIHSYPPVTITNLTPSQAIAYGSSVQLNADGATFYTWTPNNGTLNNPNINDPIATPVDTVTKYTVYGMNPYGCPDSASLTITLLYNTPEFIPSAFTPNKDGLNDVFRVKNLQYDKLVDFRVYNRLGQQVFQTANPETGWDGTFNGVPQDIGTYSYMVIITHSDGAQQTYSGNVTLIR